MSTEEEVLSELLQALAEDDRTGKRAEDLLVSCINLRGVLEAPQERLTKAGLSENGSRLLRTLPGIARRCCVERSGVNPVLGSYERAAEYARGLYLGRHSEQLILICLDRDFRVIGQFVFMEGTRHENILPKRRFSDRVMSLGTCYALIFHNHPGKTMIFSEADGTATREVIGLLRDFGIPLLDHILVCGSRQKSFRKSGLIDEREWQGDMPVRFSVSDWFGKSE